jgi:bifunctional UDP-N-acetylglucosamine pyrophosphorylase/glucosamine-1-phosphate N-acetyltransferase
LPNRAEQIGAVVLAAGRSTRFRSARSKLAHELGGTPIIQWLLGALHRAEVAPIVVVVARDADDLRATCGSGVRFAVQEEAQGTGHAVLAAEATMAGWAGSLLVLNADLPLLRTETLRRVIDTHRSTGAGLTLLTATVADPHGWGRIVRDRGAVRGIVEERDASAAERALPEVNVGVYCVRAALLFDLLHQVTPDNAQGEIYLTDIVGRAGAAGIAVADLPVDAAEVGQINSRGELAAMEKVLRSRINAKWMAAGVTLEDPDTAYIGPDVSVGRDTVIGPNVHLRGRTAVGEGCRLDGSAFVTDSKVGDGAHLRFGVVITDSEVGARCEIGPFAHLRPKTRLAEAVHIGDFVETKNAVLGSRTKANHLAYIGDAEIGCEANIGAGTITCNYDGFDKYRTVIGDRVQVGSDSTLVAPVEIGDDAYVATATTVRRNVMPGALVFNPRDQQERPGWVAAFRARKTAKAPVAVGRKDRQSAKQAAKPVAKRDKSPAKRAVARGRRPTR